MRGSVWCCAALLSLTPANAGDPMPAVGYYHRLREAEGHFWSERWESAVPIYRQMVSQYPDNPVVWEHLAEAEGRNRNFSGALAAWGRAFGLGCRRQAECAFEAARSAALAGSSAEAKSWLRKALAHAYERRPGLAGDEAFQALRQDPEFAQLAGLPPTQEPEDRDARWRYDVDFLVEEIRRMHYRWRTQALPDSFVNAVRQLKQEIPSLDDAGIQVRIQNLLARLGDGHSMLYFFAGPRALPQLPVQLYWFRDGLYVVAAMPGYEQWIGYRVEKIAGITPAEVLERTALSVSRDNAMFLRAIGPAFMTTPAFLRAAKVIERDTEVSVTMTDASGQQTTISLPSQPARRPLRMLPAPTGKGSGPLYLARQGETFWFERIAAADIVYAQINQIANAPNRSLSAFSQELSRELSSPPAAFVLDLRHNVGGNSGLLPPLVRALTQFRQSSPRTPVYVITSRSTYSAAQVLISQIESLLSVTFVGEPSSSSPRFIGEDTQLLLPYSRLMGSISTRLHQSSSIDDRPWIAPHIPVELDARSYFGNRDPAMEAILELHSERKH